MRFFSDLKSDLIEKRLWPVVLILAIAAVAVPVLLSSGSSPASGTTTTTAALAGGATPDAAAQVVVDDSLGDQKHTGGKVRDPFKGKKVKTTTSTTAATTTPTATKPSSGSGSGSSTTTSPSSTPNTPNSSASSSSANTRDLPLPPAVDVRVGPVSKSLATHTDVARLTPFPSDKLPLAFYAGTLSDRSAIAFLMAPDVAKTGKGHCWPTPKRCYTLELKPGQTATLAYKAADGQTHHYVLKNLAIHRGLTTPSFSAATRALTRLSNVGNQLLIRAEGAGLIKGATHYVFYPQHGVIKRRTSTKK